MEQVDGGTGESPGTCHNDCSLSVMDALDGSTSTATVPGIGSGLEPYEESGEVKTGRATQWP